jgi:type III pantothenate kinase
VKRLIVDIGNTRIKTAVFEDEALVEEKSFTDIQDFAMFSESVDFEASIISSVTLSETDLKEKMPFDFLFLSCETKIPFKNLYATPHTLGVDRKAAVMGARCKFPQDDVLAIDLGSCITYDLLDRQDQYLGGGISPGLQMRFRAMHQQTARLPMVGMPEKQQPELIGDSTESCMQSGVYFGMRYEMQGMVEAYRAKYPDLKVIICGGDSKIFESLTKDHIFVIPNLVLYGLNRILSYNVHYQ